MKKLAQILPTSKTCYLVSCAGRSCIIDEFKSPENGSRVLISISGRYEWGTTLFFPWRIVADTGVEINGEARIIGTVTHEIQRVCETTE